MCSDSCSRFDLRPGRSFCRSGLLVLGLGALAFGPLHAATWDGGLSHGNFTVNDLWSTANNWADGVPTASATRDVVFALSGAQTTSNQNLSADFVLRSLTFGTGSNVTALTGGKLTFASDGRVIQDSNTGVRIAQNLHFSSADPFFSGRGTGRLTLDGVISGEVVTVSGGFAVLHPLLVTMNGPNTYFGLTLGTALNLFGPVDLTLGHDTAAGVLAISFFNGNTLRMAGNRTLSNAIALSTQSNGLANVFTIGAGGDLRLNGAVNLGGTAKTLRIDNALTTFAGPVSGGGTVVKTGPGTLSLANIDNTNFTGAWQIDGGRIRLQDGNASIRARVIVNVDGGLDLNGNATAFIGGLSGSGALDLGTTILAIGGMALGPQTYTGAITSSQPNSAVLRVVGAGHELSLLGSTSSFGSLLVEMATLRLDAAQVTLGGTVFVGAEGSAPSNLVLANGAVLTLTNPSTTFDVIGPGGTGVSVTGLGSQLTARQIAINGLGGATAKMTVASGARVETFSTLIGSGSASGVGALEILDGGQFSSLAGFLGITGISDGFARVGGVGSIWTSQTLGLGGFSANVRGGVGTLRIEASGSVKVAETTTLWTRGSRIEVARGQFSTGSLLAEDPEVVLALSDPDESNSALVVGTGGFSSAFSGTLTNGATFPGGLTKTGAGQFTLSGALSYTGRTRVQQGSLIVPNSNFFATRLEVDSGATFDFNGVWGSNGISQTSIAAGAILRGNGTLRGSVDNAGLIAVTGSQTTLVLSGPVQNSGRIRAAAGASFSVTQSLVNSGVIDLISAGAVSLPANVTNTGTGRVLDRHSLRPAVSAGAGGSMVVGASGFAGHVYQLQRATSLAGGSFANLGTPQILGADGPLVFVDAAPPTGSAFYRIAVD